MAGEENLDGKSKKDNQQNAIPVLIGHHTVPPKSKTEISPGFFITHLKATDTKHAQMHEDHNVNMNKGKENGGRKKSTVTQRHLAKLFEAVQSNKSLFYTVIASVGIPVALLLMFYFEVRFTSLYFYFQYNIGHMASECCHVL